MADLLIDTDIFIDHLRGTKELELPRRKAVAYSVVTRCELFSGSGTEEAAVQRLLAPFREIEIDRAVAERAGRIRRHVDIRTPDALIAATAIVHGLMLVTRNVRHFQIVPGLRLASG